MYRIRDNLHAARKIFRVIIKPVADIGFIAIVYLKDIDQLSALSHTCKVAENNIFINLLEIVIPRSIARQRLFFTLRQIHRPEVGVKHLIITAFETNDIKKLIRLADSQTLNILFNGEK